MVVCELIGAVIEGSGIFKVSGLGLGLGLRVPMEQGRQGLAFRMKIPPKLASTLASCWAS